MPPAIKIENLSKQYRLGTVGTGTLSHDLKRWWAMNIMRREDPYLKIGETNDRSLKGDSDYVWALRNINLEVEEGEVLGIIGKNGAGKSTLLKILSKVTTPTTGSIKARGRIASLLEVGTGFHPEMTGRENIFMNGAIMGMTKAEIKRKFDEIVDFAGVERYIDTPVKRYSSGMTVRLGFAVAAHLEPEILVVDEVLAVGDAEFQKKAIGKMQDVSRNKGRTVLFVSHNMAFVEKLCKNSLMLENGLITNFDTTNKVVQKYLDENLPILNINKSGIFSFNNNPDSIIQKVELLCDDKISSQFYSNCNFKIQLYFSDKRTDQFTIIGFLIKNSKNENLIALNNSICNIKLFSKKISAGTIIIEIPKFSIYGEGNYNIDIFWGNYNEDYFRLENKIHFFLKETDVYHSGKLLAHQLNKFVLNDVKFNLIEYEF